MHEVRLWENTSTHARAVLADIERLEDRARVFRTRVECEGKEYLLVTTSKDVHLAMGALSWDGLLHFCQLLEQECNDAKTNEFLFYSKQEKGERALLVTRSTSSGDEDTYHLSPAR